MLRKQGVKVLLEIVLGSTITNVLLSSNRLSFYHKSCNLKTYLVPKTFIYTFLSYFLLPVVQQKCNNMGTTYKISNYYFPYVFTSFRMWSNLFSLSYWNVWVRSLPKKKIKCTLLCCFSVKKFETIRPNLMKCYGFYYSFIWIISVKKKSYCNENSYF